MCCHGLDPSPDWSCLEMAPQDSGEVKGGTENMVLASLPFPLAPSHSPTPPSSPLPFPSGRYKLDLECSHRTRRKRRQISSPTETPY